jgi:hypothetical protein
MRLLLPVVGGILGFSVLSAVETVATAVTPPPRAQITVENWDKGGALSRWVYTHVSEFFPSAVVRRGGAIVDLPTQLRPEIGAVKVTDAGAPEQTLDQFINNGAVDGCIVLHDGKIVYEKYPTIQPNDIHLMMSVTKAVVLTALAVLEDQGKIDIDKPIENFLPELKGSDWSGTRLRDLVDMRSGMEGSETGNDAYRDPAHKQFQLEATLGWQSRTARELPDAARRGDLFGMLRTIKRERKAGEKWQYTSSNTAVLAEVVSRVRQKSGGRNQRFDLEQDRRGARRHLGRERTRIPGVARRHGCDFARRRAVRISIHQESAGRSEQNHFRCDRAANFRRARRQSG